MVRIIVVRIIPTTLMGQQQVTARRIPGHAGGDTKQRTTGSGQYIAIATRALLTQPVIRVLGFAATQPRSILPAGRRQDEITIGIDCLRSTDQTPLRLQLQPPITAVQTLQAMAGPPITAL